MTARGNYKTRHEFDRRRVTCVSQIELLRQRLFHADGVVGMLATGWEAFEFARASPVRTRTGPLI